MKKTKIPVIIGIIIVILFIVNWRFNLIDRFVTHFSQEKYAEYVSEIDYEKELLKSPVCIKDMTTENTELLKTELDKIINTYDFHGQINEKYNLSAEQRLTAILIKPFKYLNGLPNTHITTVCS